MFLGPSWMSVPVVKCHLVADPTIQQPAHNGGLCWIVSVLQGYNGARKVHPIVKRFSTYKPPQATYATIAMLSTQTELAHSLGRSPISCSRTLPCSHTAVRYHSLLFNGLHPLIHVFVITWITISFTDHRGMEGKITLVADSLPTVVTCQP